MKTIESRENKIIKKVNALKTKKNRDNEGLFVVEGIRFVKEIPEDWNVKCYIIAQPLVEESPIDAYEKRAMVYIVDEDIFQSISDTKSPQGILAICEKKEFNLLDVMHKEKEHPLYVLVEEMNDPGNLGTVIRTADACGADGIFLSMGSVDIYNPKVLRSTMGSLFHVPIVQNLTIEEMVAAMKSKEIPIYAAHLKGQEYPYGLPLEKSCAFFMGNEARGLSEKSANLCKTWVKIPMLGQAESLNASMAAGILMYEVVRQRIIK